MKKILLTSIIIVSMFVLAAKATPISIYDIQYTTNPAGDSPYANAVVDCSGGIVIHKYPGYNLKLTLYDPDNSDSWGGIMVKDFDSGSLYNNINVGDWVSFTNTTVEEYRGNTQLAFEPGSEFNIVSSGNLLPVPIVVSPADIAAPSYQSDPEGWFVADHSAEMYEAMYLKVEDVTVTAMDLGKADDIYALQNQLDDICWAADYMNSDVGGLYHPLIEIGRELESVSGILEQYTRLSTGWDYYQMLTTSNADIVVPEPATVILLLTGGLMVFCKRGKDSKKT